MNDEAFQAQWHRPDAPRHMTTLVLTEDLKKLQNERDEARAESAIQDRVECDLRATIEMYVAEAVAREREECAKECEDVATPRWDEYAASYNSAVFDCAAAIRARAEKETT